MYLAHAMNRCRVPLMAIAALALALSAIWVAAPGSGVRGQTDLGACELSPWLRDALLSRDNYNRPAHECDELELEGLAIWDFSGLNRSSFEISDADYEILLELSEQREGSLPQELDGFGTREEVRLIDLTGTNVSIARVDFRNIPIGTGIALSVRGSTSVVGFQEEDYTVRENSVGYVSVAFPGVLESNQESLLLHATVDADSDQESLVNIGRDMLLHGDARNVFYYWPIYVASDNDNDDSWDFDLEFGTIVNAYPEPDASGRRESIDLEDVLNGAEAGVEVLDADAPNVEVCERSDLVEDAIDEAMPNDVGHRGCGITLGDLGRIDNLELVHEDGEAFELASGDLEGLSGLRSLRLKGVSHLPRGIFAGIGDTEEGVVIDFDRNDPGRSGELRAGDYDLDSIPSHIIGDLEPQQTLLLTGKTDSGGDPLVTGLDQGSYRARAGESFAVTLPLYFDPDATTPVETYYVVAQIPYEFDQDSLPVVDVDGLPAVIENDLQDHDVVRTMIAVPEIEDDEKGQWVLFVFTDDDEDFASLVDWALIDSS